MTIEELERVVWNAAFSPAEGRIAHAIARAVVPALADDIEAACAAWGEGYAFCDRLRALVVEACVMEDHTDGR